MADNSSAVADVPIIEQPDPTWQYPSVGALLALGERLEVELAPDETIGVAADGLVGSLNSPHSTTDDRVRVGDVVLSVLDGSDGDSSDAADGTQAARQLQSLQFVDAAARERLRLQVLRPTQAAPGAAASDADAPPWWQSAGWWRARRAPTTAAGPTSARARQVQWGGAAYWPCADDAGCFVWAAAADGAVVRRTGAAVAPPAWLSEPRGGEASPRFELVCDNFDERCTLTIEGSKAKMRVVRARGRARSATLALGATGAGFHAHRTDGAVLTIYQRDRMSIQLRAPSRRQRDHAVALLLAHRRALLPSDARALAAAAAAAAAVATSSSATCASPPVGWAESWASTSTTRTWCCG